MPQIVGGHAEQIAGNHDIAFGDGFEAAPLYQSYRRVDNGLRREAMLGADLGPKMSPTR
jgi:hypothetical protein